MPPFHSINHIVLRILSGLLASTSWATISDVVMILWVSRNREDRAGSVSQSSRYDRDLQRRESRYIDCTPISLEYHRKGVRDGEISYRIQKNYSYRLDAPVQVLLQIGTNHAGVKRRKTRPLSDGRVEVYETLNHEICLLAAVVTLTRRAVHECVM